MRCLFCDQVDSLQYPYCLFTVISYSQQAITHSARKPFADGIIYGLVLMMSTNDNAVRVLSCFNWITKLVDIDRACRRASKSGKICLSGHSQLMYPCMRLTWRCIHLRSNSINLVSIVLPELYKSFMKAVGLKLHFSFKSS